MPPGNAQKKAPAADAAHVARIEAEQRSGFWDHLKPQSPLFPSTTRVNVANPLGQARVAARIVPNAQDLERARQVKLAAAKAQAEAKLPKGTSLTGIAKGVAGAASAGGSYVADHPLRSAASLALPGPLAILASPLVGKGAETANRATQKGLSKLGPQPDSAGVQGAASTSAGLLEGLKGIPVANVSASGQQAARKAALFFAQHPTYKYDVPNLGLFGAKDKAAYKLPPTATDGDYIRALGQDISGAGHRDYVSQLAHNIPLNALQLAAAPVGAAYLATHPVSGGKEFAKEQIQFGKDLVTDPLGTLKNQPITTATTLFGVGRAAGGLGGTIARTGIAGDAAKAFATPAERVVSPAGFNVGKTNGEIVNAPPISRGLSSPKLDERVAQAAADWAARNLPTVGERLVRKSSQEVTKGANRYVDKLKREDLNPAIETASRLRPNEQRAITFAHGQHLPPSELADYFAKQAEQHRGQEEAARGTNEHVQWQSTQRDLDKAAELWQKTAAKQGDELSKKGAPALAAAKTASRAAEREMTSQSLPGSTEPLLSPETLLRRAYVPLARVKGVSTEDAAAMDALRAENRAQRGSPEVAPGAPLDVHDPLYFPHVTEGPRGLARIRSGQGIGITSENIKPRYGSRLGKKGEQASGELFAQGRASSDPSVFFGAAAKPAKISAALRHLQSQVSNFSVKAEPGMTYDTSKWIRLDVHKGGNVTNVHTTAEADRAIKEASDNSLRDQLFAHFKDEPTPTAQVPSDGHDYVLVSKAAHKQLTNEFLHGGIYDMKAFRAARSTTGVWRWATLLARPAWLVGNVSGGAIQSGLAGAGPVSYGRAMMPKYNNPEIIPDRVQNTGMIHNTLGKPQGLSSLAMKPVHAFTNIVADANTAFENLTRRATYLSDAVPEAKARVAGEHRNLLTHFHRVSDEVMADLPKLAKEEEAAPRIVKNVTRWLGDFAKFKNTPITDLISPFHRWFSFIGKLTVSMPVATPGRALLLQRLGDLGINVQNQAFGGFVPNYMQGALQLPASLPVVGGAYKSTLALNPFATLFQLMNPNDQSSTNPGAPGYAGLLGALNPAAGAAWNTASGTDFTTGRTLVDQYNNPAGSWNPRVGLNQLENAIPLLGALGGRSGAADTSINPLNPTKTPVTAGRQPAPTGLQRAIGYGFGSIRNFDPEKNRDVSIKRLKGKVVTEARNRLKNSS